MEQVIELESQVMAKDDHIRKLVALVNSVS